MDADASCEFNVSRVSGSCRLQDVVRQVDGMQAAVHSLNGSGRRAKCREMSSRDSS